MCSKVQSLTYRLGGCFMYFKFMRKNCKKMLTELSDYVNIFLACDAHVQCASGSVVEHLLAKEGAAGSIPVSRFFNAKKQHPKRVLFFALNEPNPGLEGSKSRLPARSVLLHFVQRSPPETRTPRHAPRAECSNYSIRAKTKRHPQVSFCFGRGRRT